MAEKPPQIGLGKRDVYWLLNLEARGLTLSPQTQSDVVLYCAPASHSPRPVSVPAWWPGVEGSSGPAQVDHDPPK